MPASKPAYSQYDNPAAAVEDDTEAVNTLPSSFEIESVPTERPGKWYHSTFHTVTAMVGAGVLGLPYTLAWLGWGWGIVLLLQAGGVSLYTSYLLACCHEVRGRRLSQYVDLGRLALGDRAGYWAVVPAQTAVNIGTAITYCVIAGTSMEKADQLLGNHVGFTLHEWILMFGLGALALVQLPDFHSLWWVSAMGAAMSLAYSYVASITSVAEGRAPNVSYAPPDVSTTARVFGVFNAIGGIVFAFGGHSVLLSIQATIASPSKSAMMRGIYAAYGIGVATSYLVALTGYWAYGRDVDEDLLVSIGTPKGLVAAANVAVVLHMVAGYQIFSMVTFSQAEELISRALERRSWAPSPTVLRLMVRSTYVVLTITAACALPFFSDLMGLIGALGVIPLTFVLPGVFYLRLFGATTPRWQRVRITAQCVLFSLLGVLCVMGALYSIDKDFRSYHFFDDDIEISATTSS